VERLGLIAANALNLDFGVAAVSAGLGFQGELVGGFGGDDGQGRGGDDDARGPSGRVCAVGGLKREGVDLPNGGRIGRPRKRVTFDHQSGSGNDSRGDGVVRDRQRAGSGRDGSDEEGERVVVNVIGVGGREKGGEIDGSRCGGKRGLRQNRNGS